MAEYNFDCQKCTNEAVSAKGWRYCLPSVVNGKSPIVLHDEGGTKKGDYFTCDEFTTAERTPAIYELLPKDEVRACNTCANMDRHEHRNFRGGVFYRYSCSLTGEPTDPVRCCDRWKGGEEA